MMIYPTNLRGGMYKKYHQDATVAKQRPSKQIRKGVNLAGICPREPLMKSHDGRKKVCNKPVVIRAAGMIIQQHPLIPTRPLENTPNRGHSDTAIFLP